MRRRAAHRRPRPSLSARLKPVLPRGSAGAGALSALAAAALVVPFLVAAPAAPDDSAPSAAVTAVGPVSPGGSRLVQLEVGGLERDYLLLPALGLDPGTPAPVVVVLHHDVASVQGAAAALGLDPLRQQGVTLAYPAAVGGSWDAGGCCRDDAAVEVDDVAFVDAVLDDVGARVPVDLERRALLGYSSGGMLAYRVVCSRPEGPPLAAAVAVNGSLEHPCSDEAALPDLLAVHGELDGTIGLDEPTWVTRLGMAPRPASSTLAAVTDAAGCGPQQTEQGDGVELRRWTGCRGGSSVEAQIVTGVGHVFADVQGAERSMAFLLPRLVPHR